MRLFHPSQAAAHLIMSQLRKLERPIFSRWVSSIRPNEHSAPFKIPSCSYFSAVYYSSIPSSRVNVAHALRWFCSIPVRKNATLSKFGSFGSCSTVYVGPSQVFFQRGFCSTNTVPLRRQSISEAERALFDYLHCTRGLDFNDSEHMSRNSHVFLGKLLEKVGNEEEVYRSVSRFLRYHPINEFEPFFESLGLKPTQYYQFIPQNMTFLCERESLLENYQTICNYGIGRGKMGKIYVEATEIFSYGPSVLASKFQAYEDIGLSKSSVINVVSASPALLIGSVNKEFLTLLVELQDLGIDKEWVGNNVSESRTYDWGRMSRLLQFFSDIGIEKVDIGTFLRNEPGFLLDGSGKVFFQVVGLLVKLGGTRNELLKLLVEFPQVQIGDFLGNTRKGLLFLIQIDMNFEDIKKLVWSHPLLLGSSSLMKPGSILSLLSVGKKRLCKIIKENPYHVLHFSKGSKLVPLPKLKEDQKAIARKVKFLSSLGFSENSKEMEKALRIFRGKVDDIEQRYTYLMNKGFSRDDITKMTMTAPLVLRQNLKGLKCKIEYLVDGLGYPIEDLIMYPRFLQFSIERMKLRFMMYSWLKEEGSLKSTLSISTIIASTDEIFIKTYVSRHPGGLEVWHELRRAVHTC